MKQTAAILLMLLLVFNITGYQLTVQWMQQKQNTSLETQLDSDNYDEASLIELSVPLSLPYYNNTDFERYNGEIKIDEITYKYVKRKVQDGRLIVKCLPNPQQQVIQKNVSELFAQVNGLPQHESSSAGLKKVVKAGLLEYEEIVRQQSQIVSDIQVRNYLAYPAKMPLYKMLSIPWQPPEVN